MKILVIGGSGRVGRPLTAELRHKDHDVTAASPSTGVNALTGEGIAQALVGAEVVVDVSNASSLDEAVALDFCARTSRNLLDAGLRAGVKHRVALSIVGTDRLTGNGYFHAKVEQERLVAASGRSLRPTSSPRSRPSRSRCHATV